ncbi:glycoside hydrolase family 26 protein [Streptomyces sp. QL37]|uniref:glycoside hydrolase family 26 protein n=1 Tax=Streptomyces sp. QL37 TaxID=2093747 RepID=UPI000CF29000|nr:glycosyl hydrolase [Streptomyces sp. QL37]PPQ61728.1 glycosyl hydrolase family 26 [Streptomyces sp. QL37]
MAVQRRLISFGVGATALCLLVGGAVVADRDTADVQAGKGAAQQAPEPGTTTAIGAYLDYGPKGVQRMGELSRWLGGTELRVGHSYLPGDLWENIEGRPGFLASWAAWRKAADDRMFVLNTPMLERNEEHVSDEEVRGLLRAGAEGQFDEHFRRLAERLVLLGVPDTVIVLGWEMNGTTYTHRCGPDPVAWKSYWNRIVTTMRSVSGQSFRFDFAPSRGRDAVPWTECYPGDDVVDIIGMDSYDQPPARTFDEQVNEPYGLQKQVDFAAEHGKPISFPEWGLFRNGDNPEYMRRMLEWMDRHRPVYQTITDYCPHGVWQCADNPESSRVFREMLSGLPDATGPSAPAPDPSGTPETPKPDKPAPTTPTPDTNDSGWCFTLPLSDWFGQWLGDRELCLRD